LGTGDESKGEILFLIDEASALGALPALEETLVRGRSAGVRLLLAYQSASQVGATFKEKPSLLYENCTTQIFLGASSYETAERISQSLGQWTQVVDSYGENQSVSHSSSGSGGNDSVTRSFGTSMNYSQCGRALLRPEEVLTLDENLLIAFPRGKDPILARRVKWYEDPEFKASGTSPESHPLLCLTIVLAAVLAALVIAWQVVQPLIGGK